MAKWLNNFLARHWIAAGHNAYSRQRWEKAISCYTKALAVWPQYWILYLRRGWADHDSGRFQEAIDDACYYIEHAENISDEYKAAAFNLRGQSCFALGRLIEAMENMDTAIGLHPHANHLFVRAVINMKASKWDRAVSDLKLAVQNDPKNLCAVRGLARLLCTSPREEIRDGPNALILSRQACEISGWQDWKGLSVLAAACAECGDFTSAIQWAKKSLALAPPQEIAARQARLEQYMRNEPFRDQNTYDEIAGLK